MWWSYNAVLQSEKKTLRCAWEWKASAIASASWNQRPMLRMYLQILLFAALFWSSLYQFEPCRKCWQIRWRWEVSLLKVGGTELYSTVMPFF
ncbi:unnamed protein product [Staurois parvus]|uniref:ATP synthase F0 subunit 8 n=1 Tax=Staurois parvus TaxID=386267 RepID=A0ABN9C2D0_9NEOB|nr:unnamed protein product [Staurois parvus]